MDGRNLKVVEYFLAIEPTKNVNVHCRIIHSKIFHKSIINIWFYKITKYRKMYDNLMNDLFLVKFPSCKIIVSHLTIY